MTSAEHAAPTRACFDGPLSLSGVGEAAVLKRQRAKEKSRSRRLWRRLCGCRQPEPEPVEEVVEEARVEVAKLRSQMNEQLSMILDQQAVRPPRPAVYLSFCFFCSWCMSNPNASWTTC